jgi:hypothetical protein
VIEIDLGGFMMMEATDLRVSAGVITCGFVLQGYLAPKMVVKRAPVRLTPEIIQATKALLALVEEQHARSIGALPEAPPPPPADEANPAIDPLPSAKTPGLLYNQALRERGEEFTRQPSTGTLNDFLANGGTGQ